MAQNIFSFILGVVITAGIFLYREKSVVVAPTTIQNGLVEKLQALTDTEIAEYYKLKDQKEKYEKANEILSKIVLLFLADLGVKLSPDIRHQAQESITPVADQKLEPLSHSPPVTQPTKVDAQKKPAWIQNEASLVKVTSFADATHFLDETKMDDFNDAIKTATTFKDHDNLLASLNGIFEGPADVTTASGRHTWDVRIELSAAVSDSAVKGTNKIVISENGKVFSTMNDGGNMNSLKQIGDSQSVFVRVSPTNYFQAYYARGSDTLIINLYNRTDDDHKYQYFGMGELKRLR